MTDDTQPTSSPMSDLPPSITTAPGTTSPTPLPDEGVSPFASPPIPDPIAPGQAAANGAARVSSPFASAPLVQTVSWHSTGEEANDHRPPWLKAFDDASEWLSDWLNPILVKETRQALKSRQFTSTFGLMLIFALGATILGVAMQSPAIFYAPSGPLLANLYYLVLLVPMLLVVPFQAFRSLAGEREEGTFEMLSVSTLKARQIVIGKLASAFTQMIVYYSALAPCLAFTYMLRGIDVVVIAVFLVYLFLASTLLSSVALLLGSVTRTRYMQVVMSVAIVVLLVFAAFIFTYMMAALYFEDVVTRGYFEPAFWYANLATPMFLASFVALFVFVAAGQISFASDNRATSVRVCMTVQHVLMAAWVGGLLMEAHSSFIMEATCAAVSTVMAYWGVMGMFLVSDSNELSPRVKRDLPQSLLARTFFTLYNPGSGTGYFLVVAAATSILICFAGIDIARNLGWITPLSAVGNVNVWPPPAIRLTLAMDDKHAKFAMLAWAYLVGYLGIGRLLVAGIRKFFPVQPVAGVLVQILLALGSCLGCVTLAMLVSERAEAQEYSEIQLPNWMWSLYEQMVHDGVQFEYVLIVVAIAVVIMAINAIHAWREFLPQTTAAPKRVQDEDRELREARTVYVPKNPWDHPGNRASG